MSHGQRVIWGKRVARQLAELPPYIEKKFYAWAALIQLVGMRETRRAPGLHDEPLTGNRKGQRSIRLNRAYRAIYVERLEGRFEIVEVIEVNKHAY